jgi:hypothetical protein
MTPAIGFYPKLKAVANGYFELFNGLDFETIDKAAKLQATRGDEAARRFLESLKSKGQQASKTDGDVSKSWQAA